MAPRKILQLASNANYISDSEYKKLNSLSEYELKRKLRHRNWVKIAVKGERSKRSAVYEFQKKPVKRVATKYTLKEVDDFLRKKGLSLEGGESARRARANSARKRETPSYKRSRKKYFASEKGKETAKEYADSPRGKAVKEKYRLKNLAAYNARTAAYKAAKLRATSPFMSLAEKLAIQSMYKGAEALSLPKRVINVDHFVPLRGKFYKSPKAPVSATGLHNIHNLRWMGEGANKAKQDLMPKQSLLQTENPTRNIFETIEKIRKSGGGGGAAPFPSSPWDPRGKLFRRWPILK